MAIDERELFEAVTLDISPTFRRRLERELVTASAHIDPATADEHIDQLVLVSTAPGRPRHPRTSVGMIAAAAAVVLVGLAALIRDGSDQEPFRPGIDTIAPHPTTPPPPSTSTFESTTSTTSPAPAAAATIVVPTYGDPTVQQLATIQSAAEAALTTFDTLRATVTWQVSTQTPGGPTLENRVTVNDVTLASNGSMWSRTPNGWSSYDSSTGTALTAFTGDDGIPVYTRYDNFTSLPLPVVLGLDPTPRLGEIGGDVEIGETAQDGRAVWEITSTRDSTGPDGTVTHTEETLEIDKATGLVVGRANTSTSANTITVQTATLTNMELNVAFPPPDFPGSFPPGAKVQGSPGPSSLHLLSVDEAAAQFGDGLVAPSTVPATARIYVDYIPNQPNVVTQTPGLPVSLPRPDAITFDFPHGFAPSSLTVFKDADNTTSTPSVGVSGASVVTAGPLRGAPSDLHLGVLTIDDGTITVIVRASSDARALEIAASLVKIN